MVHLTELLVVSALTPQTSYAVFLPQPLNTDAVLQSVTANQNVNGLHISSPKHFVYSCIGKHYLWLPTSYLTQS